MAPGEQWLFGWDNTPGIVSVWAESDGLAHVFRRLESADGSTTLVHERERFRPWVLLSSLEDLGPAADRIVRSEVHGEPERGFSVRELEGPGELRYLVRADDGRILTDTLLRGASARLGRPVGSMRDVGEDRVLLLPPEEQYLVATGRTYFRDLSFDRLRRMQIDLETTGLDPERDRIFLIAVRTPEGESFALEARGGAPSDEAELLRELERTVSESDPDVIENHNLHGFDLPFLVRRARLHRVPLALGRLPGSPRTRPAARGARFGGAPSRANEALKRVRFTVPGRELVDTMDAVRRHDFSARDLPGHGLKAVARHFGLAREEREYVSGARIFEEYQRNPERVKRYALDDVHEAAGLARLLGGAPFALARMAPRRYERLADAGAATGVLDPLLVRAYLREGAALPAHQESDGTAHQGAALRVFATGVAERIVKADVASLYPSLMCEYRIGPSRDRLGALLTMVEKWVELRLAAKARGKAAAPGSSERFVDEALSAALKLVVNSAYGYLAAASLTRFADVHAANEVTRRGRETLGILCRELSARGVTLLEADTDGVYFSVPEGTTEVDERRIVDEVARALPPRVKLEFEGRYRAMLSHEPKNYVLLPYAEDGSEGAEKLVLRGVAFRSSRSEPFGDAFLQKAGACLLRGDVSGVRAVYMDMAGRLRRRELPTFDLTTRVRLTKTPEAYGASRALRKELPYEALLATGRSQWTVGDRIRVYRGPKGRATLHSDDEGVALPGTNDPRDYDVVYYTRLLRETYAARFVRALAPEDFEAVFADPTQLSLFDSALARKRPLLTVLGDASLLEAPGSVAPDASDDDDLD